MGPLKPTVVRALIALVQNAGLPTMCERAVTSADTGLNLRRHVGWPSREGDDVGRDAGVLVEHRCRLARRPTSGRDVGDQDPGLLDPGIGGDSGRTHERSADAVRQDEHAGRRPREPALVERAVLQVGDPGGLDALVNRSRLAGTGVITIGTLACTMFVAQSLAPDGVCFVSHTFNAILCPTSPPR